MSQLLLGTAILVIAGAFWVFRRSAIRWNMQKVQETTSWFGPGEPPLIGPATGRLLWYLQTLAVAAFGLWLCVVGVIELVG